jgi:hypothetical protein
VEKMAGYIRQTHGIEPSVTHRDME